MTCLGPVPLRELGARVDALTFAFKGDLRKAIARKLDEAAGWASMATTPVSVELAPGMALNMGPRSRRGWYHLSTDELSVVVDESAAHGWVLEVKPRAVLLARVGHVDARAVAEAVASTLLEGSADRRARRVDLAADFVGFDLHGISPTAWLRPRRAKLRDIASVSTYYDEGKRTGYVVGSSDVVFRLYDKTEEIDLPQNAGAKRDEERARWRARGWDGEERIVRAEFQIRGGALDQLDVRSPDALLASLDALWSYCAGEPSGEQASGSWLRLIVEGSNARRDRCEVDYRWQAVQRVVFSRPEPPRERFRKPPNPDAARLASLALNSYTPGEVEEVLRHIGAEDPMRVMQWNEHQAERVLGFLLGNDQLVRHYQGACETWRKQLIAARGAKRALLYVLHRMKANATRRTELDLGMFVERASLASFTVKAADRGERALRERGRQAESLGLFGKAVA